MSRLIPPPDLPTLLELKTRETLMALNCHQVGTVQSFNANNQTATVSLCLQRTVTGELGTKVQQMPLLVDVPVFVLGGGDRCVTIPIKAGDTCLVLFNDTDMDLWWATGATTDPNTNRVHDLADGMALVGFRSQANPVTNYSTTATEVRHDTSRLSVGPKIILSNATTDLLAVLRSVVDALNALNSCKLGGSAATQIELANTKIQNLLSSP